MPEILPKQRSAYASCCLLPQGVQNIDIAEQLGGGRIQVARWRERYAQFGLGGIERGLAARRAAHEGGCRAASKLADVA